MGSPRFQVSLALENWQVSDLEEIQNFPDWQIARFEQQAIELLAQGGVAEAYVYLIRFQRPLGTARHSAQFYLGATTDLTSRLSDHCKSRSRGSNIVHSAVSRKIPCDLVLIIPFESKKDAFLWESNQKKKQKRCHSTLFYRGMINEH